MQVLLADDQYKVRSALRLLLEQEAGAQVVGDAVNAEELVEQTRATLPDLLLLDWELPGAEAGTLSVLKGIHPKMRVIVLSGLPEARQAALAAGANAFVSKTDPPGRLLEVVEKENRR